MSIQGLPEVPPVAVVAPETETVQEEREEIVEGRAPEISQPKRGNLFS